MQGLGYGFVMPIYAISHLLTSGTAIRVGPALADAVRTQDLIYLESLISSIIVGYILPTVLMVFPLSSAVLHQWFGGLWQGFPIWVELLQYIRRTRHRIMGILVDGNDAFSNHKPLSPSHRTKEIKTLHGAYLFAFALSALTQWTTFGIIWCRDLFPSLISPTLTFRDVFVPPVFYSHAPMRSMAIAIHNFFQYDQYVGSAAAIAWAIALHCNSRATPMRLKHWCWLVGEVLSASLIAGPAGALVSLMWNRDERIISNDSLYEIQDP